MVLSLEMCGHRGKRVGKNCGKIFYLPNFSRLRERGACVAPGAEILGGGKNIDISLSVRRRGAERRLLAGFNVEEPI